MNEPLRTETLQTTNRIVRRELRKRLLLGISIIALVIVSTGISLLPPLLVKRLFDEAVPTADVGLIILLLAGIITLPLLATALRSLQNYQRAHIGEAVSQALRQNLFSHILRTRLGKLDRIPSGESIRTVTKVCGEIGEVYVTDELLPMFTNAVVLTGVAGVMLFLNWRLFIITVIAVPLAYVIAALMKRYVERLNRTFMDVLDVGMNYLQEVIPGLRCVRAHTAEFYEDQRWQDWIKTHWRIKAKSVAFHNLYRSLPLDLIQNVVLGSVFGYGAYEIINGRMTVGGLVAFSIYVPWAYTALEQILNGHVGTGQARAAAERIDRFFSLPLEESRGVSVSGEPSPLAVTFSDVSFNYGREGFGLEGVSFQVAPGEFLGIVGPSGGGKSTVIDLLMRFYAPQAGSILVNGMDIADISLASLRGAIGLVPQDVFVWNASVYANIIYPNRSASMADVIAAAKAAQLHGFVESLPKGYDTIVGERGVALSGGERQRLAIAQALFRNSRLLLLDEATSALDALTERQFRTALNAARHGRTTIAVAHRLATVMGADRILVLEGGRAVEIGAPEVLLRNRGLFAELYSAQQLDHSPKKQTHA